MTLRPEGAHEEVRVFLIPEDAPSIMVSGSRGAFRLPTVPIPACARHAEEITAALQLFYQLDSYCLFTLPSDGAPPPRHYSFSCLSGSAAPAAEFKWVDAAGMARRDFKYDCDFAAFKTGFELISRCEAEPRRGYFGRPGWLREIRNWVENQLPPGLHLLGSTQLNASATASLVRFETDSSAVWFKAAGDANRHELSITCYLESHFPEFVAPVLAVHPESNGWLTLEVAGLPPSEHSTNGTWIAVAERLARFQQETLEHAGGLLGAGCSDIRPQALASRVEPFLEAAGQLMAEQIKPSPAPLTPGEIRSLKATLREALGRAEALDMPSALVHLDFNLGNIRVGPDRVTFLDWAGGAIGHPFFTFEYLIEQFRMLHPSDRRLEEQLSQTYLRPWRSYLGQDAVCQAAHLAPFLAAFSYACSSGAWQSPARRDPATAGHLRSMTRRMKHEAELWARSAVPLRG